MPSARRKSASPLVYSRRGRYSRRFSVVATFAAMAMTSAVHTSVVRMIAITDIGSDEKESHGPWEAPYRDRHDPLLSMPVASAHPSPHPRRRTEHGEVEGKSRQTQGARRAGRDRAAQGGPPAGGGV